MLSIIPLVWFLSFLIILYRKQGLCLSVYATLMYVITSLCAIIMYASGLLDAAASERHLLATLIYCLLITLAIWPLYRFDRRGVREIVVHNPGLVKGLVYFYLICFLFLLVFYWRDMAFRLTLRDWGDIKVSAAMGNAYSLRMARGIWRPIAILFNIMSSVSFVMIPVFFIIIGQMDIPVRFSIFAMIGSMSSFLVAVLNADRSRIFIWLIILGMCLVFFWPELSKDMKRKVLPIVLAVAAIALVYFSAVTSSRYGTGGGGALESLITYAGQPYHNFCVFFDKFNNGEGVNSRVVFPFTHTFIVKDYLGGIDLQRTMTMKTGMDCGVFYSLLGMFILDSNQAGPFLFILLYLAVWSLVLRKKKEVLSLRYFLIVFFLSVIPIYGCISYMYSHWYLTAAIAILLVLCRLTGNSKEC